MNFSTACYVNIIIHGRNGFKGLRMLVDAGSTYTVLDPKTIEELGLLETPYIVELVFCW